MNIRTALLCSLALIIFPASGFTQGQLAPVAAPAPTMKALDEIEPRINLQRTINPLPNDANYQYIISVSGSYYLTGNIDVPTKPSGIHVTAPNVTIDLNGFQIAHGVGTGGTGAGIVIDATAHRCTVKNGTITGFGNGLLCVLSGIYPRGGAFLQLALGGCTSNAMVTGDAWQVDGCKVSGNPGLGILAQDDCTITNTMVEASGGTFGIRAGNGCALTNCAVGASTSTYAINAGSGSVLTNCTAVSNTSTYGISAGEGSRLNNCSASFNTGTYGIFVSSNSTLAGCSATNNSLGTGYAILIGSGSSVANCSASKNTANYGIYASASNNVTNCSTSYNTGTGATSAGLFLGSNSHITGCTSSANRTTFGTPSATTGMGFEGSESLTIEHCTASNNQGDGIMVTRKSVLRENQCDSNGASGDGAGIHVAGLSGQPISAQACKVEKNNSNGNDRGIQVDGSFNLIVGNSCQGNSSDYVLAAGNRVGPIVSAPSSPAINGSTGGLGVGSTDPSANISY